VKFPATISIVDQALLSNPAVPASPSVHDGTLRGRCSCAAGFARHLGLVALCTCCTAQAAAATAAQAIKAGRQPILFVYVRAVRGHGVIPADKPSSPAVHLLPLLLAFSPAGGQGHDQSPS